MDVDETVRSNFDLREISRFVAGLVWPVKNYSNSDDLRGFDHWILPRDGLAADGLVVVAAIVPIGVPMLSAEKFSASAPESGQAHLPPTSGAPVHLSLRR